MSETRHYFEDGNVFESKKYDIVPPNLFTLLGEIHTRSPIYLAVTCVYFMPHFVVSMNTLCYFISLVLDRIEYVNPVLPNQQQMQMQPGQGPVIGKTYSLLHDSRNCDTVQCLHACSDELLISTCDDAAVLFANF
jgi:hypothetical protein